MFVNFICDAIIYNNWKIFQWKKAKQFLFVKELYIIN